MSPFIVASSSCVITRRTVISLWTSEIHSGTEKRKRRIFDYNILKKLGDSIAKSPKSDACEHFPYSNGIDLDPIKLPECNDPIMPGGLLILKGLQWITGFMQN